MRKRNTVLTVLLCTVFLLTACQRPAEPADKATDADSKTDTVGFENIKVRKLDGTGSPPAARAKVKWKSLHSLETNIPAKAFRS